MDSNHRPRAYQARALATWATDRSTQRLIWFSPLVTVSRESNLLLKLALERSVSRDHQLHDFSFAGAQHLRSKNGGDEGNRTLDPLLAGQVLSQLSYTPVKSNDRRVKSDNSLLPLIFFSLGFVLSDSDWSLTIEQQTQSVLYEYTSLPRFLPNSTTRSQERLALLVSRSP